MLRQSISSSKSFVFRLALSAFAVAGLAGCGTSGEDQEPAVQEDVQNIRVTSADIEKLAPGQFFNADITRSKVVYRFDYSEKQIDYSRVKLVRPQDTVLLQDQIRAVAEGNYGDFPQPDLLAASDKRFNVATNPADFGVLSESALAQVRQQGYYYDEVALEAPKPQPQNTDNCIHAVCVICLENGSSGPPVSWLPGTYTCYEEQHVWCD